MCVLCAQEMPLEKNVWRRMYEHPRNPLQSCLADQPHFLLHHWLSLNPGINVSVSIYFKKVPDLLIFFNFLLLNAEISRTFSNRNTQPFFPSKYILSTNFKLFLLMKDE